MANSWPVSFTWKLFPEKWRNLKKVKLIAFPLHQPQGNLLRHISKFQKPQNNNNVPNLYCTDILKATS